MASVTSLDADMRKIRLERYSPEAADEVRAWIEQTLGERPSNSDLVEDLKDGTILCRLANLVIPPPGIRFKTSSMPFTQRENISHFLSACEMPPLNMPSHDRFLTVDLYDSKDPAQVLQCLGAFSRVAHAIKPSAFRTVIGPKRPLSPTRRQHASSQSTGAQKRLAGPNDVFAKAPLPMPLTPSYSGRPASPQAKTNTPNRASSNVSSWSKRADEFSTAPAWNIHQYGYMGGANQGSAGINFGAPRQIVGQSLDVPNYEKKLQMRAERDREEAEIERRRKEADEEEYRVKKAEIVAAERTAAVEEEARWQEETQRLRIQAKEQVDREAREQADREAQERTQLEVQNQSRREAPSKPTRSSSAALQGQYLSQYQASQAKATITTKPLQFQKTSETDRIAELERQLAEAKERERQYELDRQQRAMSEEQTSEIPQKLDNEFSFTSSTYSQEGAPEPHKHAPSRSEIAASSVADDSSEAAAPQSSPVVRDDRWRRPLPIPKSDDPPSNHSTQSQNRTEDFLKTNPAPLNTATPREFPLEMGLTSERERAAEDSRRLTSQTRTKQGGWASKSLLEREMERERERQREWEEQQMEKIKLAQAAKGLGGPREMKR